MSSDLSFFDGSFLRPPGYDLVSSDLDPNFLSQTFFSFSEPPDDILHAFSEDPNLQISISTDQTDINFPFGSPPTQELNKLSLSSPAKSQSVALVANSSNGLADVSVSDTPAVKPEEYYVSFNPSQSPFLPDRFDAESETAIAMMQRSFSSHSLDQKPSSFFHPHFNSLLNSLKFQTQVMGSPENSPSTGHMRRVCSAGDLHSIGTTQLNHGFSSHSLAAESSLIAAARFKVGRYSAEERKERIHRYKSKRTQRNYNKTIKYACRKTLADSRPRVRGRFARSDETEEIPKVTGFNRFEEDEEELWVNGFHAANDVGMNTMQGGGGGGGAYVNGFCPSQFEYYNEWVSSGLGPENMSIRRV